MGKNYTLWGGGSTTVVSPDGGSNGDVILAELECVPSVVKYKVNTENTARPRANKRKAEEELLDPEELLLAPGEGGAGHGGGISGVRPGPAQRGDSQTSETRVSVTHPCQQHRGGQH